MKTRLRILLLIFFCLSIESNYGQAPQVIPYQAVARDNAGNLITNQNISLRFSIHDATAGGTVVYQETQTATTNVLGLFSVNVGQGIVVTGTFSSINWGGGSKFIQVEMDASGGITYIDMGTQQMLSVPYALYAATSGSATETDPQVSSSANNSVPKWNGSTLTDGSITDNGYVGIGTTTPFAKLTVQQSAGHEVAAFVQGAPTIYNTDVWWSGGSGGDWLLSKRSVGGSNDFWFYNSGLGVSVLTLKSNGNIGIGTTTPAARLEVIGTTKTNNIQVTTGAGLNKILVSDANGNGTWQSASSLGISGWSLTGNAGTNSGSNFIGTTDNNALVFKVNSLRAGYVDRVGGTENTSFGLEALPNNNGTSNAAFGRWTLLNNTTGNYNMGVGTQALVSNTSGSNNTASGLQSLGYNITGNNNTGTGFQALYLNTIGDNNTAFGLSSLFNNKAGNNGVAIGMYSQLYANDRTTAWDNTNTSIGYQSLRGSTTPANNTGTDNTAIGRDALYSNTTGSYNAANGFQALYYNTTGIRNTANGYQALYNNSTGDHNTAYGFNTLYQTTVSSYNTALGISAGAIFDNGGFNTFIGTNAYANGAGYINSTCLGSNTTMTASNQVRIGNGNITSIGGQVGWSTVSDARFKKNVREDVHGLDFIMQLKPVTYNLDVTGINNFIGKDKAIKKDAAGEKESTEDLQATAAKEKIIYSGFLAQDVEASAKKLGYDFSGVDAPKNEKDYYGLRYAEFVVPLVKAVQELSKQNEELKAENEKLKADNTSFKSDIEKIKAQLGMEIKAEK